MGKYYKVKRIQILSPIWNLKKYNKRIMFLDIFVCRYSNKVLAEHFDIYRPMIQNFHHLILQTCLLEVT